jgi:hypothetical protein
MTKKGITSTGTLGDTVVAVADDVVVQADSVDWRALPQHRTSVAINLSQLPIDVQLQPQHITALDVAMDWAETDDVDGITLAVYPVRLRSMNGRREWVELFDAQGRRAVNVAGVRWFISGQGKDKRPRCTIWFNRYSEEQASAINHEHFFVLQPRHFNLPFKPA